jgi:predicted Zn finger-like uncharacterized protein
MSLATRCPSCDTVFRIVADQLKVSEGWVRCGHCREVFNAEECLVADPLAEDPDAAEPIAVDKPVAFERHPSSVFEHLLDPKDEEGSDGISEPAHLAGTNDSERAVPVAPLVPAAAIEDPFFFDTATLAAAFQASQMYDSEPAFEPGGERDLHELQPSFIRQAERAERWGRPSVQAVLALACAALMLMLLGQVAVLNRDAWSSRWPSTRAPLLAACEVLGCKLQAPLQINDIALDSSQLTATPEPHRLRLDVALHNRASNRVLLPALEVSFTADSGQLLSRRVVQPDQLPEGARDLEGDGHWSTTLWLDVGALPVAGYTVAAFYP